MKKFPILLPSAVLLAFSFAGTAAEDDKPFEFFVMGCMPYFMEQDAERFQKIIAAANAAGPAFSVHCGDTKHGQTPCDDAVYDEIKTRFDQFEHPFIYVPGDNEWTDCHTANAGSFDPLDRLELIRRMYFKGQRSLGTPSLPLVSQSALAPEFAAFVEHNRWTRGGILFATLHVVGSNNNARENNPAAMEEFLARDAASIAWLKDSLAEAQRSGNRALVLFMQANPFAEGKGSAPRSPGFINIVEALREVVQAYAKPVYLFHADSHYFRIDKALNSATGRTLENFTRIETFGGLNLHLIRVSVDPQASEPLSIAPMIIEANRVDPESPLPSLK